jgi:hypothetical protein
MATVYREPASPTPEILASFTVSTLKGGETVGCLGAVVIIFLVTFVVSLVAGAPPEIEPWIWTFPVAAGVFALPTAWIWYGRRRRLEIVRAGDVVRLLVAGGPTLTFPLTVSGNQSAFHVRGVPMHHVYLKLVDGAGHAVLVREIRGAIHGSEDDWLVTIDSNTPAAGYEVGRLGDAARIRKQVESLNREAALPG